MDDIDRAQEQEQKDRARAIAAARQAPSLPATGQCHYCTASEPPGAHFCDIGCREDHEREQAARKRNGVSA